jgi:hypothetical protein
MHTSVLVAAGLLAAAAVGVARWLPAQAPSTPAQDGRCASPCRTDVETCDATRSLLGDIVAAAGGAHADWDTFDRVMAGERRAAVLVTPEPWWSFAAG